MTTNIISSCRAIAGMFLSALFLLLTGCSKGGDDTGPGDAEYYISFKSNGAGITYTSTVMAKVLPISGKKLYSCSLQGYNDIAQTDRSLISLVIWHENPIAAGVTYRNNTNAVNSDGDKVPQVIVTYADKDKINYLSQGVPGVSIPPFDKIVSDVQVNLTEVNATYISGTFSGTVYKTTDLNFTTTAQLTEGRFKLKRM